MSCIKAIFSYYLWFCFYVGVKKNFFFLNQYFIPAGVPVKVTNMNDGISKNTALDVFSYLNEIG